MKALRCTHCWELWLAVGVGGTAAWFGRLEWIGFDIGCHPTLSRRSKALVEKHFGPRGVWLFTALGAAAGWVYSKHLHDLPELEKQSC